MLFSIINKEINIANITETTATSFAGTVAICATLSVSNSKVKSVQPNIVPDVEFNIKLVNVVYRAYYGIENESDSTLKRCYKIGIDYRYMPRRLQCFWEIFFRNNIDLDLNM